MNIQSEQSTDPAEALSALSDGELESAEVARLCARWRDDAEDRARWHRYQLIGDVLRSEDLASTAEHDRAFLQRLRAGLASEPVVLAPEPLPVPAARPGRASRRAWRTGAAVAAGFAVVAVGALSFLQPQESAVMTAVAPGGAPRVSTAAAPRDDASGDPVVIQPSGKLIRDARLDQYLAAHQQLAGGSLLGGHAAFLRQATTDAPRR